MITLRQITESDRDTKPGDLDAVSCELLAYYSDAANQLVYETNRRLGVGMPHDSKPLQVNLLRRIVDTIAVTYDEPPTRYLVRPDGTRLADTSPPHRAMVRTLERAQYDLGWRSVDRMRALLRQCVVRLYPSDARQSVVMRIFPPQCVRRMVDTSLADLMDGDEAFALQLAGDIWEIWHREGEQWIVRTEGRHEELRTPPQPWLTDTLPVQMIYDDYPAGRAWLDARTSRLRWIESINAGANELRQMVYTQAHEDRTLSTDNPHDAPERIGPDVVNTMPRDAVYQRHAANPRIDESIRVIEQQARHALWSEDIPLGELEPVDVPLTGAALRVRNRPLHQRRKQQLPLAHEDERLMYRRLRAIHNLYAATWDVAPLDERYDVEVQIAEIDEPASVQEELTGLRLALDLGVLSMVDATQRYHRCDRSTAIRILEQVQADAAPAGEDARLSLNGAQVQAALDLMERVSLARLPREQAVAAMAAFFGVPREVAEQVVPDGATAPAPEPEPEPAPPPVEEPEPEEPSDPDDGRALGQEL